MKVLTCNLENFASYKNLNFDFKNKGLSLIHGANGAGKSTLCDAIPWVLFGKTAKGGAVDEIRSWNTKETTLGRIQLNINGKYIVIRRQRNPNDLCYFLSETSDAIRGKDLNDTQKQINNVLGFDYDLYLSSAYFHEFSQTAQFFQLTSKNRKEICEQLVDLSMASSLQENIKLKNKQVKNELQSVEMQLALEQHSLQFQTNLLETEIKRVNQWYDDQELKLSSMSVKANSFEEDKEKKIKELSQKISEIKTVNPAVFDEAILMLLADMPPRTAPCRECGASKSNEARAIANAEIAKLEQTKAQNQYKIRELNSLKQDLKTVKSSTNIYLLQMEELDNSENPHLDLVEKTKVQLESVEADLIDLEEKQSKILVQKNDLEVLETIISDFRSILIKNTIADLEANTNNFLNTYFDGEISVEFVTENDKIEVTILKDGNNCTYTQLSKGQRQLLKLCFGVSVMNCVSMHNRIRFNQIFFDEAFDGLSDEFKVKAYKLLEALSLDYESIFVVDHSNELKVLFPTRYKVELIEGNSVIYEEA